MRPVGTHQGQRACLAAEHDTTTLRKMDRETRVQRRTETNLDRLTKRLDAFRKDVYRGFARSVARDHALDKRLIAVERGLRR